MVSDIGATVSLPGDPFVALFAESAGRALVTVTADRLADLERLAASHGVALTDLGETGGESLVVDGVFDVRLSELREAWTGTLPAVFG